MKYRDVFLAEAKKNSFIVWGSNLQEDAMMSHPYECNVQQKTKD
jgi:hypothetical protein